MGTILIIAILIYLAFHVGHGHANYRHLRHRKGRRINLYYSTLMGPWASIRVGNFRIGHKL
jgi:hypothetical protein